MQLKDWRNRENKTLRELAELLGIGHGANPSRRMQRIETGEAPVDALLAAMIVSVTRTEVSLQDINDTRAEYLAVSRSSQGVVL